MCEICSDPFADPSSLDVHRQQHKSIVHCRLCNKALRDEHTLKCHIKTVHAEKTLSCHVCDKKFPHRGVLNAHLRTHSLLTYACKVCSQTFKNSSYLKRHERAHSGDRPHVCKICGKGYLQNSHLKVHMSLHTKDKQFRCDVCQKSFRLAKSFKEHENMHKNIRNFKCTLCDYSSCFRKNLDAHRKNHLKKEGQKRLVKAVGRDTTPLAKPPEAAKVAVSPPEASQDSKTILVKSSGEAGDAPVYLFVNIEDKEGGLREQILSIEDIERLDPLEMGQELSITTQAGQEEYSGKLDYDEYRPLDLSVVQTPPPTQTKLDLKIGGTEPPAAAAAAFFAEDSSRPALPEFGEPTTPGLTASREPQFGVFPLEYRAGSEEESPGLDGRFLDFPVDTNGRRRSVFLAEQLEYEHQAEMRVVDPAEVTG